MTKYFNSFTSSWKAVFCFVDRLFYTRRFPWFNRTNFKADSTFIHSYLNKKLFFFCQSHDDTQDVHVIQTENRRKKLSEFVENCRIDLYKVYLTSTIEPEDALSKDVHYHRACWMKLVISSMTSEDKARADAEDSEQENKVAADIEFLHLI